MSKIKTAYRTTMPFEGGLSPTTPKSSPKFHNVPTIKDVLDGNPYKIPGGGGHWSKDWSKDWSAGDDDGSYKPEGDYYKFQESLESDQRHHRMLNSPKDEEKWKVKVKGGYKIVGSFNEAQEYAKKNSTEWIAKVAQSKFQADIPTWLSKTFMIQSIDLNSNRIETGSCFAISPNQLMTCAHVIQRYNKNDRRTFALSNVKPFVYLNGKKVNCSVQSIDWEKDVAILGCNANLPFFSFADNLDIGDDVVVIGSPHGFENNVSYGRVGSTGRKIYNYQNAPSFFNIDANVFSGNSGGPVIKETTGEILGMVVAVVDLQGGMGLNMAIDFSYLKQVASNVKNS